MSAPKRRGRPTKEAAIEAGKQAVLDQVNEIAITAAPDAARMLAEMVKPVVDADGKFNSYRQVPREIVNAAIFLINQVVGRPTERGIATDPTDPMREFIDDLRAERTANLRAQQARDGAVVGTAEIPLYPDPGAVADPSGPASD